MEFATPDCHIKYIVALKDRLAVVNVESNGANGAPFTVWPVLP